jgi:hypothetical protein
MKMIKMIGCLVFILSSHITYSQNSIDSLNIFNDKHIIEYNKIFLNGEGMIFESVCEYKNKSINDLKGLIKNWGGVNYRSFKDVLVNETDNQLVLRYSYENLPLNTFIKTIIDLKENKIRIRIYDEGFETLGFYFHYNSSDTNLCCVNKNGVVKNSEKRSMDHLIEYYKMIISLSNQLNNYILLNKDVKKEENW